MPKIFTWNTQGSFNNGRKLEVIEQLMTRGGCVAGLIQEGGRDKDGDYGRFTAYGGSSVGAFNDRCTNYVLVSHAVNERHVRAVPLNAMGGGHAARTAAGVLLPLGGQIVMVVSWHSSASANNEDTSDLIRELDKHAVENAIIGGDFNSSCDRVEASIARRRRARKHAAVVEPAGDVYTHSSDQDIDYFVVVGDLAIEGTKRAACIECAPSDHNPVVLSMS